MGKFKDIDVVDAIKAMKTHIENGRMSLLVGSGASCCACKLYQDWYGLIKDGGFPLCRRIESERC